MAKRVIVVERPSKIEAPRKAKTIKGTFKIVLIDPQYGPVGLTPSCWDVDELDVFAAAEPPRMVVGISRCCLTSALAGGQKQ